MKSSKTMVQEPSNPLTEHLIVRLREGLVIALLAVSLYLLLALLSYNPADPGWSHTGSSVGISNSAGRAGAWLGDFIYSLLGYFAFVMPGLLIVQAYQLFRERLKPKPWHPGIILLKFSGLLLTLVAGAGLAAIHITSSTLPSGAGGILGKAVSFYSLPAFSYDGSTLLLLATFLIGVTALTNLSWFWLLDLTGKYTLMGWGYIWSVLQSKIQGVRNSQAESAGQNKSQPKTPAQQPSQERARISPTISDESSTLSNNNAASAKTTVKASKKSRPAAGKAVGMPALALLDPADHSRKKGFSAESLDSMSRLLEVKLQEFNVQAEVVAVHPGPVITRFEIQPAAGIKVSRITNLAKDIARSMAVFSVRVVEVIPGKSTVGIEVPNEHRELICFSEVMGSDAFEKAPSTVALTLGHDIAGQPVVADLAKMPHLLVAGTTGSGKSVGVNAMILSILFKSTPADVRLIMVDPKMLELSVYDGIPHLLAPVVTDMKEAANALRWCVAEMERRYRLMAAMGVRNIAGFNQKVKDAEASGNPIADPLYTSQGEDDQAPSLERLPLIVVVIDEFADMMMIVGKKVEELIARIAQKARAAGIHLILATQRPSVDVITGLIKANIPTRISFQVSSKIDSRTVLDQGGAEQLLGHGDMLYLPPGTSVPIRVHGAFVSDDEVHRVVADWKLRGEPDYIEEVLQGDLSESAGSEMAESDSEQDPLYDQAVQFVIESRRASISSVQRRLKIGYNRAARLIEAMEASGLVSSMGHNGNREVLAPGPGGE